MMHKLITPSGKVSSSADDYIIELCAKSLRPDELEWEGSFHTDRGNELEPEARDTFSAITGLGVSEVGFVIRDEPGISGCSPDGLIADDSGEYVSGLEIKCLLSKHHAACIMAGGVPPKYMPQVHGSMVITGLRTWYFMSYCPGLRPHIVKQEWDDYTDKLAAILNDFEARYAVERPAIMAAITPITVTVLQPEPARLLESVNIAF